MARADIQVVVPVPDDWRRMGQEAYLRGATLTWKTYQALSDEWEHERCQFCFRKLVDANHSPLHADGLRGDADRLAPAGYTNVEEPGRRAGNYWICAECFVESDPAAWPYQGKAPEPRPTAEDYDKTRWIEGPTGRWLKRPE